MEQVSEISKNILRHLHRTEWGDFPDVVIHSHESVVKKHPQYQAGKTGNANAAQALALDAAIPTAVDQIREIVGERSPHRLAVHALETEGANAIPRVFARLLSKMLGLPVADGIIQINRVSHTGADGYHRLALPALFGGKVKQKEYFLVDDFVGQGGTLANLKGYIESQGAVALGATALTGKVYSAKLNPSPETLQVLRSKHGTELEQWWNAAFGYGFERLTESEARYLTRADNAHAISARIIAAARKRN